MNFIYISPQWQLELMNNAITDLDSVWQLPLAIVDDVNYRRGGMSSVGLLQLISNNNEKVLTFVKRQQKHCCRDSKRPWILIPTLRREYLNLKALAKCGISTGELIYYAEVGDRAVLITKAIPESQDLLKTLQMSTNDISQIKTQVASAIAKLHQHHWQHSALYPKHIFINQNSTHASFIDLENARKRLSKHKIMLRDLDSLNRHTPGVSILQRARFLKQYLHFQQRKNEFSTVFRKLCKKYQLK